MLREDAETLLEVSQDSCGQETRSQKREEVEWQQLTWGEPNWRSCASVNLREHPSPAAFVGVVNEFNRFVATTEELTEKRLARRIFLN